MILLREAVRSGAKAILADVDDSLFNETGPEGRIAKMIARVQNKLIHKQTL